MLPADSDSAQLLNAIHRIRTGARPWSSGRG